MPRVVLPAARPSVGEARSFLAQHLRGRLEDEAVETAVLLVSEVVTNAVLHADPDGAVEVAVDPPEDSRGVLVRVRDQSPARPVRRDADPDALGGRGLALVEGLADGYGVINGSGGKTVWFALGPVAAPGPIGW